MGRPKGSKNKVKELTGVVSKAEYDKNLPVNKKRFSSLCVGASMMTLSAYLLTLCNGTHTFQITLNFSGGHADFLEAGIVGVLLIGVLIGLSIFATGVLND
jgi:hypothetical protein